MGTISHLEPTRVFTYFEEMCQIPHGSRNLQKISDYFVKFAKEKRKEFIETLRTGNSFGLILVHKVNREYILIDGANCSKENALELVKILKGMDCILNLIMLNEVKEFLNII